MGSSGGKIPEGDKGSIGLTGPPATLGEWKALKLPEGITNLGEPYSNAECAKDSIGFVYLRGVVKSSGKLVKESILAELPEGYIPKKQHSVSSNLGGSVGNILVLANGRISISIEVTLESDFYFDNIYFPLV